MKWVVNNKYMMKYFLFLQTPSSQGEWLDLAADFDQKWNYPHCCGSIDGKHITLQAPKHSGSDYFNYKGYFSIVLMAIVNANYCFTYVSIGCQGRISDGGVFGSTEFKRLLETSHLHLPAATPLPGRTLPTPYVFVCDDAFQLLPNMMKPYPGAQAKGSPQRIYNGRHSRARRTVENVFGIMSAVFRVLRKPLLLEPLTAENVVLTCCLLHNFLRKSQSASSYTPPGTFDDEDTSSGEVTPGHWRIVGEPTDTFLRLRRIPRKPSDVGRMVRNEISAFFQSEEGSVPWQNRY